MWDVQTSFVDTAKRRRRAATGALLSLLEVIGAPVRSMADVPAAIVERERILAGRLVEPVVVAREGEEAEIQVTWPGERGLQVELTLEDGRAWPFSRRSLTARPPRRIEAGGAWLSGRRQHGFSAMHRI